MFDWFKNIFQGKSNPVGKNLLAMVGNSAVWTPANYEDLAREGYTRNVYVYTCVREIAMALGGIDWLLMQRASDGTRRPVYNHPIMELLQRPNPESGATKFMEAVTSYHLLSGNAYVVSVGPSTEGPPKELWTLRPDKMKVLPGSNMEPIGGYVYDQSGIDTKFPREQVLHIKSFNPLDAWYGLSAITPASKSIDALNIAKSWSVSMLQNSGRPSGVFSFEGELSDKQVERLKTEVKSKIEGSANAGKVHIMEGGAKWIQTGMNALDMDWLEGQKMTAREVAIAFNIPTQLIGDVESTTYSNYKEARKAFYLENILPRMDFYRDELNRWLIPKYGDSSLALDYDRDKIEALQSDRSALVDMAVKAHTQGLINKGEARELIGFDPDVEDKDQFVMPVNLMPTSLIGVEQAGEKAFNLRTAEEKVTRWKAVNDQRQKWTQVITQQVIEQFVHDRKTMDKYLSERQSASDALTGLDGVTREMSEGWEKLLHAIYLTVGEPFAQDNFSGFPKGAPANHETKAHTIDELTLAEILALSDTPDMMEAWYASTQEWFRSFGVKEVLEITSTTRKGLQLYLEKAVENGVLMRDIQASIAPYVGLTAAQVGAHEGLSAADSANLFPKQHAARIEAIARTETGIAANLSNSVSAQILSDTLKIQLNKQWIAIQDGRTRQIPPGGHQKFDHLMMNDKIQPKSKLWEVPSVTMGSSMLMFPMDPGGAPANIINCRCAEVYIPV